MEEKKTFSQIIQNESLVLVDFFAEWCGPCKVMQPILSDLKSAEGESIKILKVDVDKNPNAAGSFQVRGVPTLVLFKNGKQVWRQSGVVALPQLRQLVQQFKNQ